MLIPCGEHSTVVLHLGSLPFPSVPLLPTLNAAFLWLVTSSGVLGVGRFSPEESLTEDSGAEVLCLSPLLADNAWCQGWKEDL